MPRYSYVVACPVLIALCVGINIKRYPAVSAMLRGEAVESRWLGRSEVFDFKAKQPADSKSYQGYRTDSDDVTDSRATSRAPIPLPSSPATLSASTTPLQPSASSYSTRVSQPDATNTNSSSTGGSLFARDSNSNHNDSYDIDSYNGGRNGLSNMLSSPTPYNNPFTGDSYRESVSPAENEYRNNYNQPEDRNDNIGNARDRSESRPSSDNRYFRQDDSDYYDTGSAVGNAFRMDSPMPGYSSRFPAADETDSVSVTSTSDSSSAIPTPFTETEPVAPQMRRPLSLKEKLELRLATPFSLFPSESLDVSSEQYIPPDFLPPHENGVVGKLIDPSMEPAVAISPFTFESGTTMDTVTTIPADSSSEAQTDYGNEFTK